MNFLLISNKSPYPPIEGASVVINNFINALVEYAHNVHILAMQTPKYPVIIPTHKNPSISFDYVDVDTNIKLMPLVLHYFLKKPYHITRFTNKQFTFKIEEILKHNKIDIVFFETLFTTQYLPIVRKNSTSYCVFRSHNIEHLIWQRLAKNEKNTLKKHYFRHVAGCLKRYELDIIHMFDAIAAISKTEADYYRQFAKKTFELPVCLPITPQQFPVIKDLFNFYFIGAFDWQPNIEGLRWFAEKVMPLIEHAKPSFQIHIAGRSMPEWMFNLKSPYVRVYGKIDNLQLFLQDKHALIVPLLSGGGIRIKIIEAMAFGKAIVSTSVGAEGIGAIHNENILIADNAENFFASMLKFSENPNFAEQLAGAAVKFAQSKYSNQAVIKKLVDNGIL